MRRRIALVLGATAGGVDAVGYVMLFQLFTAHMTGNTDRMAVALGHDAWHEALRHFLPIPFFVIGVILGGLARKVATHFDAREGPMGPLVLEALAIAVCWIIGQHVPLGAKDHEAAAYYVVAALLAFAMGSQTTALRRIADHSIRTTFITGMLAVFGEQVVEWWFLRRRAAEHADATSRGSSAAARATIAGGIWVAYVAGALTCTLLERRVHFTALALPFAGIVASILLDRRAMPGERRS